jgi:predicted TIM-barrel fold metal-dependent hydrolase
VDDERLAPLFDKAAELGVPIMFHIADPDAFFLPIDPENERYEELAAHPEWSFHGSHFSKQELLAQRDRVFARHPRTTFVAAHVAERPENLEYVGRLLDTYPNVSVDIGARCAELGRQPYTRPQLLPQALRPHSVWYGSCPRARDVPVALSLFGNRRPVF